MYLLLSTVCQVPYDNQCDQTKVSCAKLTGCNDVICGLAFTHTAMIRYIFKMITPNYTDLQNSLMRLICQV